MYIYLDESGDLGFNISNASKYFCITILVCHDRNTALAFKTAVKRTLRHKFNHTKTKHPTIELKGTSTTYSIKQYFLRQLQKSPHQNWEIHSIIMDKSRMLETIGLVEPHRIYNQLSRIVLDKVELSNATNPVNLIVDRCKSAKQRAVFDAYLRVALENKLALNTPLNIRHSLSHDSAGLQSVDLFCHGIARKYLYDDRGWYQLFADRIVCELEWPLN